MKKLFFREKVMEAAAGPCEGVMIDRQKLTVAIVGIGHGAGTTFIAMGLAFRLAEMTSGVTFAETSLHRREDVSPYRLLAADPHFRDKAMGNRKPDGLNIYGKVNWQIFSLDPLRHDRGKREEDGTCTVRDMPGRIIIADNPGELRNADIITAVVDPFPPRISAGLETFKKIKEMADSENPEHRRIFWLLNKSGEAAFRRETERFLRIKFDIEQAAIPQEIFYRAAYSCTQPYFICEKAALAGINSLAHKISESI